VAFDSLRVFATKGTRWWKQLEVFGATTRLNAQDLGALGENYSVFILFCCGKVDSPLKCRKWACSTTKLMGVEQGFAVGSTTYEDQLCTEMYFLINPEKD